MSSSSLTSGRRATARPATARMARRDGFPDGVEAPPMNQLQRTEKVKTIKTCCVPAHIAGLTMLWPPELKDVITSCGLEGTMHVRSTKNIDRQHALWLLNNLDPTTMDMRFSDGQFRNLGRPVALRILGLNGGNKPVPDVNVSQREWLVGRVLRLMGEDENKPGGLSVKFLFEFLEKVPPFTLTEAYKTKIRVAYTLLALSSYLAPRYSNPTVSEEAMFIVLSPYHIGEYDLTSYVLKVLRDSAFRARVDQQAGCLTVLAGGCLGLLEVFSFDWSEIPELEDAKHVSPRIAVYTGGFLKELIKRETYETPEGKFYGMALVKNLF